MFKQYKLRNFKFILVMYVAALNIIGILLIGSAKESVQGKQIFGMVMGLAVMLVVSLIDYNFILRFSWAIYGFMTGILIAGKLRLIYYHKIKYKKKQRIKN